MIVPAPFKANDRSKRIGRLIAAVLAAVGPALFALANGGAR